MDFSGALFFMFEIRYCTLDVTYYWLISIRTGFFRLNILIHQNEIDWILWNILQKNK